MGKIFTVAKNKFMFFLSVRLSHEGYYFSNKNVIFIK